MKTILGAVSIGVLVMALVHPVQAAKVQELVDQPVLVETFEGVQVAEGDYAVSEGQAADIALATQPEAKVIKVKLLPSGIYAVTLKEGGNVTRVMVDAQSGAIL